MSIRLKLAGILALAISSAIAASVAVFAALEGRSLRAAEEEKLRLLLSSVQAMAEEAQLARDPLMLLDYLAHLRRERPELAGARVRYAGREESAQPTTSSSGRSGSARPGSRAPAGPVRAEALLVPADGDRPELRVELDLSRRVLEERLAAATRAMTRDLARAGAVVLLLGLLVSVPLGWTLTSRLLVMERAMEEVGQGRLDADIPEMGADEVGRLARGFNAMIASLRELESMKRTFVASVTHELRTPLYAIESYVSLLLKEDTALGEGERRQLERIQDNAARLGHFVTSLLDMAKIEQGKLDYRPREADLAKLVEDAVLFQRPRALEQGKTINFSCQSWLTPMRIDPDLLTQVLTNLISNAIKFTRPGGRIDVALRGDDNAVVCEVRDDGVGIPKDAQKRLFKPFERVANPLRAAGTGLGLSIAKSLVEVHGGRLELESEPGKGSVFRISLPRQTKPARTV